MTSDHDHYDVFLDTWKPSELLKYATLPSNLNDPVAYQRLLDDSSGDADLIRTPFAPGKKVMDELEKAKRQYHFFQSRHAKWSGHFREYLLSKGLEENKLDNFIRNFANLWVEGPSRRQGSLEMMGLKASIRDHDREYHARYAGRYVVNHIDRNVAPTFTPLEIALIFEANERLLEALVPDYLDCLGDHGASSINHLYVRRGVYMPYIIEERTELYYLSSYSIALGPVEQFAQTWTTATEGNGVPTIFSAPLPALQQRVIAFAPFIEGMDLAQLELVVAPPIEPTPLKRLGEHGGIYEFEFE